MATQIQAMERLFQALGDSTRLRILGLLQAGEVCVCDIHDSLKISQPKASRHLAYLKKAGLVEARREGLWMYYRLAENTDPVVDTVRQVVTHTLSHVDSVRRDAGRLEKKTGCCLPDAASTSLKCCAGSSSRATS